MHTINPNDLSGEERFEMEAAFGRDALENGEVVQLDPSDLKKPAKKHFPMQDALSEGDYIEYQTRSGKIICGTVTEVKSYGFDFDRDTDRCGIGCGFTGYDGFGGERGTMLEPLTINGESVDVDYEPVIVEDGR